MAFTVTEKTNSDNYRIYSIHRFFQFAYLIYAILIIGYLLSVFPIWLKPYEVNIPVWIATIPTAILIFVVHLGMLKPGFSVEPYQFLPWKDFATWNEKMNPHRLAAGKLVWFQCITQFLIVITVQLIFSTLVLVFIIFLIIGHDQLTYLIVGTPSTKFTHFKNVDWNTIIAIIGLIFAVPIGLLVWVLKVENYFKLQSALIEGLVEGKQSLDKKDSLIPGGQ